MGTPFWESWAMEGRQEEGATFFKPKEITPDIQRLIDASVRDRFLGDIAKHKDLKSLVVFQYNGVYAGFAIPRRESDGHYRTGPIFTLPAYRRKGVAGAFVKDYFKDKKGRAFIEDDNRPSRALYESAGFVKTGKKISDGDVALYEYLKR